VRRLPGGDKPGVYALKPELDAWRLKRGIHQAGPEDALASPPSVAVLPFLNLGRDDEDQYFADGLADEIITALSRLPGFRVTARTSSFAFRGKEQDIREIGRRLNARAVLEGSVRRSGGRLRVTAQLIETAEGYHLWSERFDRELTDVFAVQDDITRAVVEALRVRLSPAGSPATAPTNNPEAYRLWLKGRHHTLRQTPNEIVHSRECFAEAITLDPAFARAHLGLAECWWEGAVVSCDRPRDAVAASRRSLEMALALDPSLGEAHAMQGVFLGVHDFDWDAAGLAFRRAIELGPFSSPVRTHYAAWFLEPNLRIEEARAQLETALEFDPLSPVIHTALGHELIFRCEFAQAAKELQLAVDLDPGYWMAHLVLAGSLAFQQRFEDALTICEKALHAVGGNPIFQGSAALLHALLGNRSRAEELRQRLLRRPGWQCAIPIAWVHLGFGEVEPCLEWLAKGVTEREPLIVELNPKPLYSGIRSHPRFQALLAEMHLAPAQS
jgi:serine/threonine-protein kinase